MEINNTDNTITINFVNKQLVLKVETDWGTDIKIKGKDVVAHSDELYKDYELDSSEDKCNVCGKDDCVCEYASHDVVETNKYLIHTNKRTIKFTTKFYHNGYYGSYLVEIPNIPVTIVIGLPGSGKTTLLKEYEKKGSLCYDDILSDNSCNDRSKLFQNDDNKYAISDPRFTSFDCFERFMDSISNLHNIDLLTIMLFENNPNACIKNVKLRGDTQNTNGILKMSKTYDIYEYLAYCSNCEILQVYQI